MCQECKTPNEIIADVADDIREAYPGKEIGIKEKAGKPKLIMENCFHGEGKVCAEMARMHSEANRQYGRTVNLDIRVRAIEEALNLKKDGSGVFELVRDIYALLGQAEKPFPEQEIEAVITKTKTKNWTVRDDILDYAAAAFKESKITNMAFCELEKVFAMLSLYQCEILLKLLLSRTMKEKS